MTDIKLLLLHSNTWSHLTVCKTNELRLVSKCYQQNVITNHIYFIIIINIIIMSRVFANGPGDRGSIPGRVIPKTFKMVLDTSLLNTQQYKVRIKRKLEQSREKSSASPTARCSSYWKVSLLVAIDNGRQYCWYIFNIYVSRRYSIE